LGRRVYAFCLRPNIAKRGCGSCSVPQRLVACPRHCSPLNPLRQRWALPLLRLPEPRAPQLAATSPGIYRTTEFVAQRGALEAPARPGSRVETGHSLTLLSLRLPYAWLLSRAAAPQRRSCSHARARAGSPSRAEHSVVPRGQSEVLVVLDHHLSRRVPGQSVPRRGARGLPRSSAHTPAARASDARRADADLLVLVV
jgi:hypothetical protein